ncbi:MAG: 2'-5' RNA ligase [Candidatus Nanohaloarchaea archaeon]|jgi:2'-5' RNA ligase
MTRVFTAVEIENDEILDELQYIQQTLDMNFRTIPPEKMHITLEFFQDLDAEEVQHLIKHLKQVDLNSFNSDIEGVGAFPSNDHIRVVWAGVEAEEFQKLHEEASSHDLVSDNSHEFHPHITLFRVDNLTRKKKKKLRKGMREYKDYFFGQIKVSSVKVYESRLSEEGAEYRVLEEIKF